MRRPVTLARPHVPVRPIAERLERPRILQQQRVIVAPRWEGGLPPVALTAPDVMGPHLGYSRQLTPDGGVLFTYKDIDTRLRHTLRRIVLWSVMTGTAGWFLLAPSPREAGWGAIFGVVALAVVNWLIVRRPVEVYRTLEVRHDCMILDGKDLFWARMTEGGGPGFYPDGCGNLVLCGIYGTRLVEFLTARRFDDHDRMPEVFAAHLQEAMRQLWVAI